MVTLDGSRRWSSNGRPSGEAGDEGEAVTACQGVEGERGAQLAGAGPLVGAAMHDPIGGMILRHLLAVAGVGVGLDRERADSLADETRSLKHGRDT